MHGYKLHSLRGWLWKVRPKLGPPFDGADGYDPLKPHMLRHVHATELYENMPANELADRMGHSIGMLQRVYVRGKHDHERTRAILNELYKRST
jgi:integrase